MQSIAGRPAPVASFTTECGTQNSVASAHREKVPDVTMSALACIHDVQLSPKPRGRLELHCPGWLTRIYTFKNVQGPCIRSRPISLIILSVGLIYRPSSRRSHPQKKTMAISGYKPLRQQETDLEDKLPPYLPCKQSHLPSKAVLASLLALLFTSLSFNTLLFYQKLHPQPANLSQTPTDYGEKHIPLPLLSLSSRLLSVSPFPASQTAAETSSRSRPPPQPRRPLHHRLQQQPQPHRRRRNLELPLSNPLHRPRRPLRHLRPSQKPAPGPTLPLGPLKGSLHPQRLPQPPLPRKPPLSPQPVHL